MKLFKFFIIFICVLCLTGCGEKYIASIDSITVSRVIKLIIKNKFNDDVKVDLMESNELIITYHGIDSYSDMAIDGAHEYSYVIKDRISNKGIGNVIYKDPYEQDDTKWQFRLLITYKGLSIDTHGIKGFKKVN